MKFIASLCLVVALFTHGKAGSISDIYGNYQGKAYVESGSSTENFKATVRVVETSTTMTTAKITFKIYGTVYEQILKFREDGSIYGVVRLDGVKQATLKGRWILEENQYKYRGTIKLDKDSRTPIAGSLKFQEGGILTATGRLPDDEKFRFRGAKS